MRQYLNGPGDQEVLAVDTSTSPQGAVTTWTYANTVGTIQSYVLYVAGGTVDVQHRLFDAFGIQQLVLDSGTSAGLLSTMPTVWSGSQLDVTTQLYALDSSWYDPAAGRQISDQGGLSNYAYQFNNPIPPAPTGGSGATPISRATWEEIGGANGNGGVTPGGALVTGLAETFSFGNADWLLGTGAREAHSGSGYYFAGLGVGVAGQIAIGNWAAGVTLANAGHLAYTAAKTYQVYALVGDAVGINQSSTALANGTFTPLDALGFAPTIGWASSAYRGMRGVSQSNFGLSRSLGLAGDALPHGLAVDSTEWAQLQRMIETDTALSIRMGGKRRTPSVILGSESKLDFDLSQRIYDIHLQTYQQMDAKW